MFFVDCAIILIVTVIVLVYGEVISLSVNYNKLWHLLLDKGLSKTELRKLAGVSTNVIAKLGKNENVNMDTLGKICVALNCDISDILEMTGVTKEGSRND